MTVNEMCQEITKLYDEKHTLYSRVLALQDHLIEEKSRHIEALKQRNALWNAMVELVNALAPEAPMEVIADRVNRTIKRAREVDAAIRRGQVPHE